MQKADGVYMYMCHSQSINQSISQYSIVLFTFMHIALLIDWKSYRTNTTDRRDVCVVESCVCTDINDRASCIVNTASNFGVQQLLMSSLVTKRCLLPIIHIVAQIYVRHYKNWMATDAKVSICCFRSLIILWHNEGMNSRQQWTLSSMKKSSYDYFC